MTTQAKTLTENELKQFETQGYLIIRNVLDDADLAPVTTEYEQLLKKRAAEWYQRGVLTNRPDLDGLIFTAALLALARTDSFDVSVLADLDITLPYIPFVPIRRGARVHAGPSLLGLLTRPAILDAIEDIIGGEIMASPNQHTRMKLPIDTQRPEDRQRIDFSRSLYETTGWHQDAIAQAPQSDLTDVVTCWLPMADVDETSGCLAVIPGSHWRDELIPWPPSKELVAQLDAAALPLPLARGDLILMHRRLLHCSRPNNSPHVRWSFDFRYFPASQASDRPWYPNIVVRSRQDPTRVMNDAAAWQRQWHAAYMAARARNAPLPARRQYAKPIAEMLITIWESGKDHVVRA